MNGQRNGQQSGQRIGIGYDVHAFASVEEGRALVLGGVAVPFERGLAGHSDADVVAHAIADALLGAARLGDIGEHFPDTDPTFAGISSLVLLSEVKNILHIEGWHIVDVDTVIIAQAPRLSAYRDAMRQNLALALGIDVSQVGIKATTTERLGFEGRGEGIAASAVALLTQTAEGCVC